MRVFIFIRTLAALLMMSTTSFASVNNEDVKTPEVVIPEVVMPEFNKVAPITPPAKVAAPESPRVVLCQLKNENFVISDSDGFGLCKERGGIAVAGTDSQRELKNIKDAGPL